VFDKALDKEQVEEEESEGEEVDDEEVMSILYKLTVI